MFISLIESSNVRPPCFYRVPKGKITHKGIHKIPGEDECGYR